MLHEISHLQFGVMSSEEIIKNSVAEITSSKLQGPNTVYDPRMGVLDFDKTCVTCGQSGKQCVGHFGHIVLQTRICNPLYIKVILSILKCICFKCSRLLLSEGKLYMNDLLKSNMSQRFTLISKFMDKVEICSHCNSCQPKFVFSNTDKNIYMNFKLKHSTERVLLSDDEIFKLFCNMNSKDIKILGLQSKNIEPKDLVFNVIPILPPCSRPFVVAESLTCDDDLTLQYVEVLKCNMNIIKNENEIKKTRYIQMLKFRLRSLFDNSNDKQKVSNGRPMKGIKKRLSGKDGLIRNNLMGKRVDKSARSVIGPDPFLKVNEIGIPHEIAKNLSYSVKVNRYNKTFLEKLIQEQKVNYVIRKNKNNETFRINIKYGTLKFVSKIEFGDLIYRNKIFLFEVKKETDKFKIENGDQIYRGGKFLDTTDHKMYKSFVLEIGDIVERQLINNDILLLNRQPTLHRGSMIAQRIKIMKGKTIRLNLAVTSSFNADFDGDEMNLFCPSSIEAETELEQLSTVDNFMLNPQNSSSNISIVQDTILAIFKLTLSSNQYPLEKHLFFLILSSLSNVDLNTLRRKRKHYKHLCGRLLFSMLLPDDFSYRKKNQVDPEEETLEIEYGILQKGALNKKDVNRIINLLYMEYDVKTCEHFINNVQYLGNKFLLHYGFSIGIKDCIIFQNKQEIEYSISKSLMKAKSISDNVKNERIRELYTRFSLVAARDVGFTIAKNLMEKDNNFRDCVNSGAKGQYFNITQIVASLGQQEILGQRIPKTLNENQRTLPHYPVDESKFSEEMKYESRGFIFSGFLEGLKPREYFFHSLVGREGITDTSMKTSTSGYIQRRMVKTLEDIQIAYDGTLRRGSQIIQFNYGKHYLNPSHSIVQNNELFPVDIDRLIDKINCDET